jgi:exodeoxyribonuclease-3
MKIVSWNVNGLRARVRDGTLEKVLSLNADVYCFQELKLSDLNVFSLDIFAGYHVSAKLANKKGYSGVCILSKDPPKCINKRSGYERADDEGRYLRVNITDELSIISLYMPHGKRDKSDIPYKLSFINYLQGHLKDGVETIICTDFNIAHKEIDLARPTQNKNNVMFTSEERKVIDDLLSLGYVDAFRNKKELEGCYTWWPFSFDAYERNLGWRIDYFFIPEKMTKNLKSVDILREIRSSDHVPIIMELL